MKYLHFQANIEQFQKILKVYKISFNWVTSGREVVLTKPLAAQLAKKFPALWAGQAKNSCPEPHEFNPLFL